MKRKPPHRRYLPPDIAGNMSNANFELAQATIGVRNHINDGTLEERQAVIKLYHRLSAHMRAGIRLHEQLKRLTIEAPPSGLPDFDDDDDTTILL